MNDLTTSSMIVDKTEATEGDTLTYVIDINNTSVVTATNVLVEDTIPIGTSYVIGSADSNKGILFDSNGIKWLGELIPGGSVMISFQVKVEQVNGITIENQAVVTDPAMADSILLQADTVIPPVFLYYLPTVIR